MYVRDPLRETVVCVQSSLASTCGLSLQAVRWDHHEDEVRQVLFLSLVQVIQIQAFVLLIPIHALIIDMIKAYVNQTFSGFFFFFSNFLQSKYTIYKIIDCTTATPVILLHNAGMKPLSSKH